MSSRPLRRSGRRLSVVFAAARVDGLEGRLMMSSATPAGTLCMCAACLAARAAVAKGAVDVQATIQPLESVAALGKSVRTAVQKAGASLFAGVDALGTSANGQSDHLKAIALTPFTLDLNGLRSKLKAAPAEFTPAASNALELALPTPGGGLQRFKIVTSQVMDSALAAQFPMIKTYRGVGIDDPTADIRLDTTPAGLHVQVLAGANTFYIDPYFTNDAAGTYAAYFKADAIRGGSWSCSTVDAAPAAVGGADTALEAAQANGTFQVPSIVYGGTLKTYRAAVAGNRPYVVAATTGVSGGATTANGVAAVVTAMNRVTGVYETELSIRMTLVAGEASIVYGTDNPNADPYSNTNGSTALGQNVTNLNTRIGSANFDIGHVFTTGSGGIAGVGVVGTSSKARGTTGTSSPVGDSFTIDFVAHEIGHQFGANHTFNTADDTTNRSDSHAYEPGSGVSIMAYAGVIANSSNQYSADNLANNSIPYFHSDSIDAIRTFVTSSIPSVGTATSTGDNAPTVSAGANYVIPTGTPFALTASGSDPDGDTLTYDWQERDLGAATNLSAPDNGASPLFRQFAPTTSPTRVFPLLSSVLAGLSTSGNYANSTTSVGERLPTVARAAMKFRVIARDNRVGGGAVSTADMQLQVVNTGAAFLITSFNSAATLAGGSTQTINWNVAGTTANGINAASVNVLLSTDGGNTFPITLAASTANDGTEAVRLPYGVGSAAVRIKVQPTNNVFFDINNANLTLTNVAAPTPSATPSAPVLAVGYDTGVSPTDNLTNLDSSSSTNVLRVAIGGTSSGSIVELLVDGISVASVVATGTITTITTPVNAASPFANGTHTFAARQTESGKVLSATSASTAVTVDTVAPAAPTLLDLDAASDSGVSNSDNLTNDPTPDLTVVNPSGYTRLARGTTQFTGDYATGTTFTDPAAADGTITYATRAVDAAGNVSPATTLAVTVDTAAPAAPTLLDLDAASDSGVSATDDLTNDTTPSLSLAVPETYLRLTRDGAAVTADYATAPAFTDAALADGSYVYALRPVDAAGNVGAAATLRVSIDTLAPLAPTLLDLVAASDSGVSASDDLTNDSTPSFAVAAETDYVRVARGATQFTADYATGTTITDPGAADGTFAYAARAVDAAGNVGPARTLTVTIDTVAPATPGQLDLDAASDSGLSDSDNLTNDNTPSFTIDVPETYYRLARDGTDLAGNYASGTAFTDAALADGEHAYGLRAVDAAGNVSATALTLGVTIDTVAPTLSNPTRFDFETAQTVRYAFGEDVLTTLNGATFTVRLADGTAVTPAVTYDATARVATLGFAATLADGDYTATLHGLSDPAGNAAADDVLNFFVLAGDANRDRKVDFDDLLVLAQNYGSAGQTFSQGNFNYGADGAVDFDDLLILAQQYGRSLDPLPPGATPAVARPATRARSRAAAGVLG